MDNKSVLQYYIEQVDEMLKNCRDEVSTFNKDTKLNYNEASLKIRILNEKIVYLTGKKDGYMESLRLFNS